MTKTIHIDSLVRGMQLGAPVKNKFNQVLYSANQPIEEKHIKLFKTWGIQSVEVITENVNDENSDNSTSHSAEIKRLSKFFNWEPKNEIELDMFEMAKRRFSELNIWDAK
jgi:hypothetical protein